MEALPYVAIVSQKSGIHVTNQMSEMTRIATGAGEAIVVDCLLHSQHSCRPPTSARWAASTTPDDVRFVAGGRAPRGVALVGTRTGAASTCVVTPALRDRAEQEGHVTTTPHRWTRRTTALMTTLTAILFVPALVAGANAVGRVPVASAIPVTAQAPSHFAHVARQRVGARDSMTGSARAASVSYQRARVRKAMLHFTTHSKATSDMRGVEPSLYRGRFFKASKESIRRCIVKRESEGQYDVRGGGGNRYFGAYQMSDALADGATHMMLKEHKKILGTKTARSLMKQLRATPPNSWPRYWQDAAFSTVYNWESPGSGARHWAGGRWHC